jgi:hypothetical protein
MTRIITIVLTATALIGTDDPPKPTALPQGVTQVPSPVEFKIRFWHYGVTKEPIASGEIVASRGRIYQTLEGSKEIVVFDSARKTIEFLDLGAKRRSDLTYRDLDEAMLALRSVMTEFITDSEKKNSKAGRIAAEMKRSQLEPRFQASYTEAEHRLKLSNAYIQVDASGVVEPDPARLAVLGEALMVSTKLVALREAGEYCPFPQLDAFSALIGERKLRPEEMTFMFRLAGPPEKHRWVYELVPSIPDRERAALDKIDSLLMSTQRTPFDRYERRIDLDEIK